MQDADLSAAGDPGRICGNWGGYEEAAKQIKRDRATSGFSHGVAMGVMSESVDFINEKFYEWSSFFEEGGRIAQNYCYPGGHDYGNNSESR